MCGNFSQQQDHRILQKRFGFKSLPPGLYLRESIFPQQSAWVVLLKDGEMVLREFMWGLIPRWVKDYASAKKIFKGTFNARAETVAEKPSFRIPFKRSRCIVPAVKFYEYRGEKGGKQRVHLGLKDWVPYSFAGLYDGWTNKDTGEVVETFTIITCEANSLVARYHPKNRMPVIFTDRSVEEEWLDPGPGGEKLPKTLPDCVMECEVDGPSGKQTCKWFSMCPMKRYYEGGTLDQKWIDGYCKGNWKICVRYEMEESGKYHPDWMLPDGRLDLTLKKIPGFFQQQ